jgi:hypothetical protein
MDWLARVELGNQPVFRLGMGGALRLHEGEMKERRLRAWRLARAAHREERKTAPVAAPDLPPIAAKADDLEEIKPPSAAVVALLSLCPFLRRGRGGRRHP